MQFEITKVVGGGCRLKGENVADIIVIELLTEFISRKKN